MFAEEGVTIEFDKHCKKLLKNSILYETRSKNGALYILGTHENQLQPTHVVSVFDIELWHVRLGHVFQGKFVRVTRETVVNGLCLIGDKNILNCEACTFEKHRQSETLRKAMHF